MTVPEGTRLEDPGSRGFFAALIALTALLTAARFALAAAIPLSADEAYYWEWSRRLDFGYFDHPPMIAWLLALSRALLGDREIALRTFPILMTAGGGLLLFDMVRRMTSNPKAAFAAAAAAQVAPVFAFGGVFATPDAPLVFFWTAGIHAAWLAYTKKSIPWWLAAGLFSGLAMASKYTGVLFPLSILLFALSSKERRKMLAGLGPYLSVAAGAAVFSPVLAWNAARGFGSFGFQLGHGFSGGDAAFGQGLLELLGAQVAILTPPLFLLGLWAAVKAVRDGLRGNDHSAAFNSLQILAVFGILGFASLFSRGETNWTAPAYPALFALLGAPLAAFLARGAAAWKKTTALVTISAACAASLLTGLQASLSVLPLGRDDPTNKLFGWPEIAKWADSVIDEQFDAPPAVLLTDRYQLASTLAYYCESRPFVLPEGEAGSGSQYNAWSGPAPPPKTLYISWYDKDEHLRKNFTGAKQVSTFELERRGRHLRTLRAWVVEYPRSRPADPQPDGR